jgi:hypothetical protein
MLWKKFKSLRAKQYPVYRHTGHKIQMKIQILMNMVIITENVVFFIFSEFEQLTLCAFTRHIIKHQYYGVLIHQLYVVLKIKYELLLNV